MIQVRLSSNKFFTARVCVIFLKYTFIAILGFALFLGVFYALGSFLPTPFGDIAQYIQFSLLFLVILRLKLKGRQMRKDILSGKTIRPKNIYNMDVAGSTLLISHTQSSERYDIPAHTIEHLFVHEVHTKEGELRYASFGLKSPLYSGGGRLDDVMQLSALRKMLDGFRSYEHKVITEFQPENSRFMK